MVVTKGGCRHDHVPHVAVVKHDGRWGNHESQIFSAPFEECSTGEDSRYVQVSDASRIISSCMQ